MTERSPGNAEIDAEIYRKARGRMLARKGLIVHAVVYAGVNTILFLVNVVTPGPWWFYWPLFGWGIGLAVHAVVTFVPTTRFASDWEDRTMARLIEEERRKAERHGRR